MPRASNGTYTLYTPGNPVQSLTTISSAWANNTLDDIAQALTDSLSRSGNGGMQAPLALAAGAVGTPGLTWSNETTSGLYRAGAGDFRWAISGADVLTITAAGISPVGISGTIGGTPTWTDTHTFTGLITTLRSSDEQLRLGGAATNPFLSLYDSNSARVGYLQYADSTQSLALVNEEAGNINLVAPTGSLTFNGNLVPNVASDPTWTGRHVFSHVSSAGAIQINNALPIFAFYESDATANNRAWRVIANGEQFSLQASVDDYTVSQSFMDVSRTGTTIDSIAFSAASVTVNGNEVGYRGVRQFRTITGNETTNATDPGGAIEYIGPGGHTLTLSASVSAREIIMVLNGGSGNLTISPSASMVWYNGSGSLSLGNRTLAVGGVATLISFGGGAWGIWGVGLS
jgi:hypothetical protein